jgi:xeroderma pigmentosum group C-complementing protein
MRAATVGKKREIEVAEEMRRGKTDVGRGSAGAGAGNAGVSENGEVMQGMYAESQTELYIPEPVIDVRVPDLPFPLQPVSAQILISSPSTGYHPHQ